MVEISTGEAAERLRISRERVGQMLRRRELRGRQLDARGTWLVDLTSVHERARLDLGRGRPWSERSIRAVVQGLSTGEAIESAGANLIRANSADTIWRRISQAIVVDRYETRNIDDLRPFLSLTGESAMAEIGESLVGTSRTLSGYLIDVALQDLVEGAQLIPNATGNVAIHRFRSGDSTWITSGHAQRGLIAVDCARAANARVRGAGLRAVEEMRRRWLARNI